MASTNPPTEQHYKKRRACDAFLDYMGERLIDPNVSNDALVKALAIIWSRVK